MKLNDCRVAGNDLAVGAVPHTLNLIINHCTLSGIALNRCWAQLILKQKWEI
jgi:hypothetical protein